MKSLKADTAVISIFWTKFKIENMRVVIQRVSQATVRVEGEITGQIGNGLLIFAGFEEEDDQTDFEWIAGKIIQLRIFPDENQKMNLSALDTNAGMLVVSQFTLHASTKKGNRPSYIKSSKPEKAEIQYENFVDILRNKYIGTVETGRFGADMKVELLNDGPVTIWMDSKNKE